LPCNGLCDCSPDELRETPDPEQVSDFGGSSAYQPTASGLQDSCASEPQQSEIPSCLTDAHLIFFSAGQRTLITDRNSIRAYIIPMVHTNSGKNHGFPTENVIRKILPKSERINNHNCYLIW
jgi:Mor family transcriptional regulator